jgi:predicted amidohydrolase
VTTLALAQLAARPTVDESLDAVKAAVAGARRDGADLLILPEAFMRSFGRAGESLVPVAETLDGPFVHALRGLAAEHDVTIVAGMYETATGERVHNTVVVVDRDGGVAASYRKLHLYDAFGVRESERFVAGTELPPVVTIAGHRVGIMTCYDLRFPELARALVDQGATLLVVPAAWFAGPLKEEHWTVLLRARAIENTVFVAGVGQPGPAFVGRSALVDPLGVVRAELGDREELRTVDIDWSLLDDARRRLPSLEHRRFDVRLR